MSQPVTWGAPDAERAERGQRADAARNRRLLLATAREMLAGQEADKLTMDALAERAGLGKGTVFRRFGTRAGIFQALLDDDERAFQQQVLSGPPPLGPGAAPLDRLIAYGRAQIDLGPADLEILAMQLTAALDGPLLLYLSAADLADTAPQTEERLARSWQDLVQRVGRPPR